MVSLVLQVRVERVAAQPRFSLAHVFEIDFEREGGGEPDPHEVVLAAVLEEREQAISLCSVCLIMCIRKAGNLDLFSFLAALSSSCRPNDIVSLTRRVLSQSSHILSSAFHLSF